jgi:tyrosinase
MSITRKDVWKLGAPWNETLLWYAKAVAAMQQRPITDKTSWRYLAAMHGFEPDLWRSFGYLGAHEALPPATEQRRYWQQCQHQSWYFLPWHRAYLLSFEAIVRAAVVALKGPADWALPYWNYSDTHNPNALKLPTAFGEKKLPDGSANALFVEARHGTGVAAADVDLTHRIAEDHFTGTTTGALEGVGGPRTPFSHSGQAEGLIEAAPHDLVHVDVGGRGGLMSDPRTAALDPIFWVHHANIDRLWAVWLGRNAQNHNPSDAPWLKGPADRAFATFGADGKDVPSTPADLLDLKKLGYDYEDTSDPLSGKTRRALRLESLVASGGAPPSGEGAKPMPGQPTTELLGASEKDLKLGATRAVTEVRLAAAPRSRLSASFAQSAPSAAGEPDRVFLNLENIRGKNGAATFDVFLRSKTPGAAPAVPVGAFSLFGLESASDTKAPHGGAGLTKVLEVTRAIDAMHLGHELDANLLEVQIVPRSEVRDADAISIGQVSLYRQRPA